MCQCFVGILVSWLLAPHGPATPPERNKDLYEGELARVVPNLNVQAIYLEKPGIPFNKPALPENGLVPVNYGRFRCVKSCDDNLGRLLDALNRLGYAENTVVIYCSDNGYYTGEHGLGDKRSAYEESLRITLTDRNGGTRVCRAMKTSPKPLPNRDSV